MANRVNPVTYTGDTEVVENVIRAETLSSQTKGNGEVEMKVSYQTTPKSTGRKDADETTQPQTYSIFHEKGRLIQRVQPQAQWAGPRAQKVELRNTKDCP